jgi:hypothetical protein
MRDSLILCQSATCQDSGLRDRQTDIFDMISSYACNNSTFLAMKCSNPCCILTQQYLDPMFTAGRTAQHTTSIPFLVFQCQRTTCPNIGFLARIKCVQQNRQ